MLISLLLMTAAEAAVPSVVDVEEPNPKAMSRSEISEFNSKLSRQHPYYIRCKRIEETGSLVRKIYSCRTNEQWDGSERSGNQNARDTVEAMQSKGTNGS